MDRTPDQTPAPVNAIQLIVDRLWTLTADRRGDGDENLQVTRACLLVKSWLERHEPSPF